MTDYPRFQMANSRIDERYRHYYGAPQVALVFRLADWWLERRRRMPSNQRRSIRSGSRKAGVAEELLFDRSPQG